MNAVLVAVFGTVGDAVVVGIVVVGVELASVAAAVAVEVFDAVENAVAVAVGVEGVGVCVALNAIGQQVVVSVRVQGISQGAVDLVAIVKAVVVAVGHVWIGADDALLLV